MKKKMDEITKVKLVYSGELLLFSVVFLVLGLLFLFGVITVADWKRWAFSILTCAGGAYFLFDFIWCLASPKKRAKVSLLDKILVLPMAIPVFVFDILAFVKGWVSSQEGIEIFRYVLAISLLYYSAIYLFEAFYHYKHPIPGLIDISEESPEEEGEVPSEEENHEGE